MKRKLYRLRRDRVVGGVSAGLAEYFSIDTLLVRVIFIVMAFFNGIGIIAYLIMWMVIPENPNETPFVHKKKKEDTEEDETASEPLTSTDDPVTPKPKKGRFVFGGILILVGALLLAKQFFPFFDILDLLPYILILLGILLLITSKQRDTNE